MDMPFGGNDMESCDWCFTYSIRAPSQVAFTRLSSFNLPNQFRKIIIFLLVYTTGERIPFTPMGARARSCERLNICGVYVLFTFRKTCSSRYDPRAWAYPPVKDRSCPTITTGEQPSLVAKSYAFVETEPP